MSKKISFGKLAGIIFCILAAACTVALLCVNVYFGGQMKVIDKFYTALTRDDFEGYKACFSEFLQERITEEDFAGSKDFFIPILQDNENNHAKVKFIRRERRKSNEQAYEVKYSVTVYNDSEYETETYIIWLERTSGKWLIYG